MADGSTRANGLRRRLVDSAAVVMVLVTLIATVAVPTEALAGSGVEAVPHSDHHCTA